MKTLSGMRLAVVCFLLSTFLFTTAVSAAAQASSKKYAPSASASAKEEDPLPLKPSRKIEFTSNEGTWLSLDVSPDGQTIIFELLGDLYTVPMAGGDAKKLTSGMAFNSQPHYSPDGKIGRASCRERVYSSV